MIQEAVLQPILGFAVRTSSQNLLVNCTSKVGYSVIVDFKSFVLLFSSYVLEIDFEIRSHAGSTRARRTFGRS